MKPSSSPKYVLQNYFSAAAGILILVLNIKNGYQFEDILIHTVSSYCLVYFLIELGSFIFERFEILPLLEANASEQEAAIEDFELKLVHNDYFEKSAEADNANSNHDYTGQVEPSLSLGLPDDVARMELKQRMGLQ